MEHQHDGRGGSQFGAEDVHEPDHDADEDVDARPPRWRRLATLTPMSVDIDGKRIGRPGVALELEQALPA